MFWNPPLCDLACEDVHSVEVFDGGKGVFFTELDECFEVQVPVIFVPDEGEGELHVFVFEAVDALGDGDNCGVAVVGNELVGNGLGGEEGEHGVEIFAFAEGFFHALDVVVYEVFTEGCGKCAVFEGVTEVFGRVGGTPVGCEGEDGAFGGVGEADGGKGVEAAIVAAVLVGAGEFAVAAFYPFIDLDGDVNGGCVGAGEAAVSVGIGGF